ncbi:MAG: mechanosensitive ion channel domain-containing protein [Bacteroidota bacterium]
MARLLFILAKWLLFGQLLFVKLHEDEWAKIFRPAGKIISNGYRFSAFFEVLLNLLILALGLNLAIIFLASIYRRRKRLPRGSADNVLAGLQNVYVILMTGLILMGAVRLGGIDSKSFFTGISIVAAAIAIITKDYIDNLISGIAISFSDEVRIGDYIKIGEHKGKVTDISNSRISLLNDDDDIVFIPNKTVFISDFINYTKKGLRRVTIEFELDTHFKDTIEELEKDLVQSIAEYHPSIETDSFRLRVETIRKDALTLKFQFTLKQINREMEREIRRKTVRQVVRHVRPEGMQL